MDKQEQNIHWFTKRSSPRLCFWLGIVLGIMLAVLAGFSFLAYLYSGGKININPVNENLNIDTEKTIVQQIAKKEVNFGEFHYYYGDSKAPLTLAIYTDYECQLCRVYQKNVEEFVNSHSGKVNLVIKNFIVTQKHPEATNAAVAAICSGEQGSYYSYSKILFDNQSYLKNSYYLQVVQELNLDNTEFNNCLNNEEIKNTISEDYNEGINLGVSAIPSTIIIYPDKTLQLVEGNVSQEFLESLLKDYL